MKILARSTNKIFSNEVYVGCRFSPSDRAAVVLYLIRDFHAPTFHSMAIFLTETFSLERRKCFSRVVFSNVLPHFDKSILLLAHELAFQSAKSRAKWKIFLFAPITGTPASERKKIHRFPSVGKFKFFLGCVMSFFLFSFSSHFVLHKALRFLLYIQRGEHKNALKTFFSCTQILCFITYPVKDGWPLNLHRN